MAGMIGKARAHVRVALLKALARVAMRSECVARRCGLVGLMGATVIDGPHKGLPLGVSLAIDRELQAI